MGKAFQAYEAERRPATAAVVLANRANAHDEVLEIAERRAPNGFSDIREVASEEELASICAQYRQTAQFDKETIARGLTRQCLCCFFAIGRFSDDG